MNKMENKNGCDTEVCAICEMNDLMQMMRLLDAEELGKIFSYPDEILQEILALMYIEFDHIIKSAFNGIIPDNLEEFKGVFNFSTDIIIAS